MYSERIRQSIRTIMETQIIGAVVGLVVFVMFWRLCSNIGAIRKGIDIISEYTLIQAKKEGIKKHE